MFTRESHLQGAVALRPSRVLAEEVAKPEKAHDLAVALSESVDMHF
jgi:hypothetical protein